MQDAESTVKIPVLWRGTKFIVEMDSGSSVHDFGNELQKLTDVKADTMRLIVPQFSSKSSKLLYPFSDEHSFLSLQEIHINDVSWSKSVRMMGVPEVEVDEVLESAKADLRIAGFDEEDKRLQRRILASNDGPIKLPQGPYVFGDFRTLHIPGVELNPPASEALKRMHRFAADPGIVAIMNKHRWHVGIMTEMAPVGYVGVSPQCILGLNKNHGEEISLRLRTDDLKGFRKYETIKKTLLHELAHMVYSEHDANFYALDKQLNQEAASLDWTRSQGRTLGSFSHSDYDDDYYVGDVNHLPRKLGGNTSDLMASARASSVVAAYRRMENASFSNEDGRRLQAEPDPDDSGFLGVENPSNPEKMDVEPDPDDHPDEWRNYEPDPDESHSTDPLKGIIICDELTHSALPLSADSIMSEEPDPDDSIFIKDEVSVVPLSENSGMIDSMNGLQPRAMEEPDPDESGKQNELEIGNIRETLKETTEEQACDQASKPYELSHSGVVQRDTGMLAEPDPDDSLRQRDELSIEEPYPDDQELARIQDPVTALCNRMQKAIKMLQREVNPMEAAKVLQTLVKIIGNVIEHPDDMKFKRLRKGNPLIQRNIANHKAAMEILSLIGFIEDVIVDEIGKVETYLVLKRNDPGLLWLAKSSIETVMAC